jgi:hypothetical protein
LSQHFSACDLGWQHAFQVDDFPKIFVFNSASSSGAVIIPCKYLPFSPSVVSAS